jgi:hypothetical protein
MALELEQERAGMGLRLCLPIGGELEVVKEFRVEKPWVRLTRPGPIARLLRIAGDCDLFPHFETHLEIFGDLSQVVPELVGGGKPVEGRIVPYYNWRSSWIIENLKSTITSHNGGNPV